LQGSSERVTRLIQIKRHCGYLDQTSFSRAFATLNQTKMRNTMKRTLLLLVCFAVASPLLIAQSKDEHSAHHPQHAAPAGGAEAPPPATPTNAQRGPSAVDQGMKHLQDLMTQIEQSSDPAEREALLHEHMIAMLEQLKLLRSQTEGVNMAMMMMGDGGKMGMMSGDKKKGAMKSNNKDKRGGMMCSEMMADGMMGGGMMGMHKMMEKRLGMVEQLLEQAIDHAHMREAAQH
jgi:hypothetical protein